MTERTSDTRYQAQHRAPSTAHLPGRLPIAGSLAVLVVAGGSLAVSCTATGQQEKASWQTSTTTSSVEATPATDTAQMVSSLTDDELAGVKRVVWSLDGRLLAIHDKGTPLRSLGNLSNLADGGHKLTAVVELEDGRTLTLTAPFSAAASSPDVSIDARAERSAQRQALSTQAAQKARQQQQKQQQVSAAAATNQRPVQANQAAQPAPAKKVAAPRPAAVQPPTAVKPAPKQAAIKQVAQKPAVTKQVAAKPAAPKQAAPAAAAPKAAPPPQTAPTTTAPTTQQSVASGSFDPAKFDWTSVGGPSKATGGGIILSSASATLSNCNIGSLRVNADGPKISRCTINGGVFGTGGFTLDHSFVTSSSDGMDPTGTARKVIQYNKIWRDGTRVAAKHHDGIQFWQGGNALISHNWISGFHTSAIMVKADKGTISDVTIDSNYLGNPTGYYQLYLCKASHDLKNITVTNNAFAKARFTSSTCGANLTFVHTEAQRQAAIKAGNAGATSWIVWNNNYVAGTHAVVGPPGGWDK